MAQSAVVAAGPPTPAVAAAPARHPMDHPPVVRGVVTVIADRCKECEFCVHYCPQEVLEISPTYNAKGYRPVRVKDSKRDECIACRFCQDVCPEYAIFVEEAGK